MANSAFRAERLLMTFLRSLPPQYRNAIRRLLDLKVLRVAPCFAYLLCAGCGFVSVPHYTSYRRQDPGKPSTFHSHRVVDSEESEILPAEWDSANLLPGGGEISPFAQLSPVGASGWPQRVLGTTDLTIEKDGRGREYAVYVLKAGEALYSSVVVRFCGVVDADEVNALAQRLMTYNGIRNPSRIPAGARIKIPVEYLDEDILAGGMPDKRSLMPPPVRPKRPSGRDGLHVILDAGHGGNDPGTTLRGWSEDEIAYDIMTRLKRILENRGVAVHTLVADEDIGDKPQDGKVMRHNRNEYVKVSPPYRMQDSRVSLNMRIYLVDDIYRRLRRGGVRDENIMLVSIHLDHLHPAVNGVMVYYPDAEERPISYSASGRVYANHSESRVLAIRYGRDENQQVQAHSYAFANDLISVCRQLRVPVHEYQPIRRFVHRLGIQWTPGIINYSRVRTSVLIEAANLANRADFNRIRSSAFRQRIAEAIARAIQ